ncbi:MAG: ribosome silencing factor [Chloroflexota bacterium]
MGCVIISVGKDKVGGAPVLEGIDIARKAVETATEKQAGDIVLLDTREVCSFADYFVIGTVQSERQLRAVYDEIAKTLKEQGVTPHHSEGDPDSGWLILDYGDVVIHLFAAAERETYQLDELWQNARSVLRIQ